MTQVTRGIINTKQKLGLGMGSKRRGLRENSSVGINDIWCADLVAIQHFMKWNNCYRYLMVLDIVSKYGWIILMKNKSGDKVVIACRILVSVTPR